MRQRLAERSDLIERRGVVERLRDGAAAAVPVVLVQAPAGYGKTVALRQWAEQDPRPFVWARLRDTGDHGQLQASVRSALERTGAPVPPMRPVVLVLDDVSGPSGANGLSVIGTLSAELPPGSQVVVVSRHRLDPVHDLGIEGRMPLAVEIRAEHLAFTREEARDALAELGLECPPAAVHEVVERTEGWPAGIYLAGLSMRGQPDPAGAVVRFTGADVRVVEYLKDEVLDRQPDEVRDFLVRTSVLDQLAGPVCDAVLDTTGSRVRLDDAVERSLFLIPSSRGGGRLRYHRLFAEMLRSQLRDRFPDEIPVLHRRAAAWFVRHGQPESAIGHALAAGDVLVAARLVNQRGRAMVDAGRIDDVRAWIEALGEEAPHRYPPLGVTAAWVFGLAGDVPRALRNLLTAERGSFEGPLPDGSSSLGSAVAMVHATMAPRGVEHMLVDARRAVELEPPGTLWRPTALLLLGNALLMTGDTAGAAAAYRRSAGTGAVKQPGTAQIALAQLSLIAAGRQDWTVAASAAAESARLMHALGRQEFMPSLLTFAARARVTLHEGPRDRAADDVVRALKLYRDQSPLAYPWLAGQSAVVLGDLLLDLEDPDQARQLAAEARRHLIRLLSEGVLSGRLSALEARIGATAHPGPRPPTGLSEAQLRVLRLLATHMSLREIGAELHLSRNTVKSHVAAIHRKLDCTTRTQAVQRGRALELIDG